jgi:hypothetical protein
MCKWRNIKINENENGGVNGMAWRKKLAWRGGNVAAAQRHRRRIIMVSAKIKWRRGGENRKWRNGGNRQSKREMA